MKNLKEIVESRRCGDNSCMWGRPDGAGPNGGCQCQQMDKNELRRELIVLARELRRLVNAE